MVQEAYAMLGEAHVFVCDLDDPSRLLMANPFSAVPTPFKVSARGGSYYGNCVWDGLGIASLLGGEGLVEPACPDCSGPLRLRVGGGKLVEADLKHAPTLTLPLRGGGKPGTLTLPLGGGGELGPQTTS